MKQVVEVYFDHNNDEVIDHWEHYEQDRNSLHW